MKMKVNLKLKCIALCLLPFSLVFSAEDRNIRSDNEGISEGSPQESKFSESEASDSILIVENEGGTVGTAFIALINERVFAVTNLHVISRFGDPRNGRSRIRTLRGEVLNVERVFGVHSHDVALIQFSNSEAFRDRALEVRTNVHSYAKSGDEIIIPGNSRGGGVVLWTKGHIKGLGPSRIEHDAPTVAGNSGSPIIHLSSNTVIGVDTFTQRFPIVDPFDRAARESAGSPIKEEFRYFGYRIDTFASFYSIDLLKFRQQQEELEKWRVQRNMSSSFILSFLGINSDMSWINDSRLRQIERDFVRDAGNLSARRERFIATDGVYDYYQIFRTMHPKERSRLRRRIIGQLHNYIDRTGKERFIRQSEIYPFFAEHFYNELDWSRNISEMLHTHREFLTD